MAISVKKAKIVVFFLCCMIPLSAHAPQQLKALFPLYSFKNAVDVCMRCYTEMLLLEERLTAHEKYEELLDLLVGRIMRLSSYIDQIIHDYRYEATICNEEMEYLTQLLSYMEITLEVIRHEKIPQTLNGILAELKQKLKDAVL